LKLIVGLGNPGARYAGTRHNAGFLVLDELAQRWGVSFRRGKHADECAHQGVWLVKPTTFMNLSGAAVQATVTRERIAPAAMLVVHDDIDLPLGRLRLRRGGGAGGQKGVRDIIARVGGDFDRLKVGVSRPPEGWTTEDWVLSRFAEGEQAPIKASVARAADAIERLLRDGWDATIQWLHTEDQVPSSAAGGKSTEPTAESSADADENQPF
jgi:PTH1 family peptidyl-tRNA hydrolase